MNRIREIDALTRQTRRREFDDGLMDLVYGVVVLALCAANWLIFSSFGMRWLATALIREREITTIGLLALVAVFVLAIFGLRRLVSRIRRAYFWRDSGVVEPLRWQVSRPAAISGVVAAVALIVLGTWLMSRGLWTEEQALRTLPASVALGTALLYLGMGIELRVQRYALVGVAGVVLAALTLSQNRSFSSAWLAVGIGWMAIMGVSGLWALRRSVLRLAASPGD